jgi:hypothetical protein
MRSLSAWAPEAGPLGKHPYAMRIASSIDGTPTMRPVSPLLAGDEIRSGLRRVRQGSEIGFMKSDEVWAYWVRSPEDVTPVKAPQLGNLGTALRNLRSPRDYQASWVEFEHQITTRGKA